MGMQKRFIYKGKINIINLNIFILMKKINSTFALFVILAISVAVGISFWRNSKNISMPSKIAEVSTQNSKSTKIINSENNETEKVVKSFYDWYFEKIDDQKTYDDFYDKNKPNIFFKNLISQSDIVLSSFVDSLVDKHYPIDPIYCTQGDIPVKRSYKQVSILKGQSLVTAQHDNKEISINLKNIDGAWRIANIVCPDSMQLVGRQPTDQSGAIRSDWKTYQNNENGFEVGYPKDMPIKYVKEDKRLSIGDAPYEPAAGSMSIGVEDKNISQYRDFIKENWKEMPCSAEKSVRLGDNNLQNVICTEAFAGGEIEMYFIEYGKKIYTAEFIRSEDTKRNDLFRKIIATLKFIK